MDHLHTDFRPSYGLDPPTEILRTVETVSQRFISEEGGEQWLKIRNQHG